MYTVPGDATLDGSVDGTDWTAWYQNAGRTNATWRQSDFTYDGSVDGQDFFCWHRNAARVAHPGPPVVLAIARMGPRTTSSDSLQFAVAFSRAVTEIDLSWPASNGEERGTPSKSRAKVTPTGSRSTRSVPRKRRTRRRTSCPAEPNTRSVNVSHDGPL